MVLAGLGTLVSGRYMGNENKVLFSLSIGITLDFHPSDQQMSLPIAPDENDSSLLKSRRPSKTLTLDEE